MNDYIRHAYYAAGTGAAAALGIIAIPGPINWRFVGCAAGLAALGVLGFRNRKS